MRKVFLEYDVFFSSTYLFKENNFIVVMTMSSQVRRKAQKRWLRLSYYQWLALAYHG